MKKWILVALTLLPMMTECSAQEAKILHVCPPSWWVGMHYSHLQVLVYGSNLGEAQVQLHYPGVTLESVQRVSNPRYLFLNLQISQQTPAGTMHIQFHWDHGRDLDLPYSLAPKPLTGIAQGISSKDLIYLLMPDRFSDGDTSNDRVAGMHDQSLDRTNLTARHGGDIQGVINHLDYFKRLGVTTIWMTPVLENNELRDSYHGYAFTDHYKVDPRLGTNELYRHLVSEAHAKGLKIVQDIVLNHVGEQHWTVLDPPSKDWLNEWPTYTNTNNRESVLMDPHASRLDRETMTRGWFTPNMPDLNQQNPMVSKYLIENAIWWVAYAGVDAFRIDTYKYCDLHFLNVFNRTLLEEFPHLGIYGETWVDDPAAQAFFVRNHLHLSYKGTLPSATDFPVNFAIRDALTQPVGWKEGINELYLILAHDFLYKDPMKNVVFLDNHDMKRIFTTVDENFAKFKSGFAWLLTTRGIPQMYYGDEILMTGEGDPTVRRDFPGGWPDDTVNKFQASGRTEQENEAFHYISSLAHYRQHSKALTEGKLMQFVPEDGVYVYFRYDAKNCVMVAMNANNENMELDTKRFQERMSGYTRAVEVPDMKPVDHLDHLELGPWQTLILELRH